MARLLERHSEGTAHRPPATKAITDRTPGLSVAGCGPGTTAADRGTLRPLRPGVFLPKKDLTNIIIIDNSRI